MTAGWMILLNKLTVHLANFSMTHFKFGEPQVPISVSCGLDLYAFGHHVGDQGVRCDTPGGVLGPRVGFSMMFDEFWDPVQGHYLITCLFVNGFI